MGRIQGFLAGTVFAGCTAYLSARRIQQEASINSKVLQESRDILDSVLLPPSEPRKPEPRAERPSLVETMKDVWNEEIEKSIRWVQNVDWREVRERTEDIVDRLWERAVQKGEEEVKDKSK